MAITWLPHYDERSKREGHTLVTDELEEVEGQTRLRVVHSGFIEDSHLLTGIREGWPWILSRLKLVLEGGA
ncbi:MAG: SRPBCC domain-containing protein [Pseudomonadales bacterium]|nr:SRPBCC domain-containing protein [Pseudomonadales bacterium]MDP6470141.1 SRPBCC domain-containing protein [Pseudomonadales bacterium]MDP6827047.1 SRPBCC domain-containing protein [Pseudomonadales bacterium]MDP6972596.1 SRPBCC domain-containing protein [Pseudomonadales bacterium]